MGGGRGVERGREGLSELSTEDLRDTLKVVLQQSAAAGQVVEESPAHFCRQMCTHTVD